MSTPREIIEGAFSKSAKNRPGAIATEATELLEAVKRTVRGVFALAARINPVYFADDASMAFAAPGWAMPTQAESVFRIEDPNGTEVIVVPFDQRDADTSRPAVYFLGKVFRSAGNADDPTAGNLTFFYSKVPDDPADVDAELDALWPEQFDELLMHDLAIYLAMKDGRSEEVDRLRPDRDRWVHLFAAHLEHAVANEVRASGHVRRVNVNTLIPIFLAGGAP